MAERACDGKQQSVGGRQRRGKPPCSHQRRNDIGQTADFRHRQHNDVTADRQLVELQDVVAIHVHHRQQVGIDLAPRRHPLRQLVERRTHQHVEDLVLDQHGQRWRRDVQQEDEKQRPRDRFARLLDARRRVVAHEDVRQRSRPQHEADDQCQEITARVVVFGLLGSVSIGIAGKLLGVAGHPVQRLGLGIGNRPGGGPAPAGGGLILGQSIQRLFCRHDIGVRRMGGFQIGGLPGGFGFVNGQRRTRVLQLLGQFHRTPAKDLANLDLGRIVHQPLLHGRHLLQLEAIDGLGYGRAHLLHGQPHHRDQIGHDQDDVLRDLRPGHRPHAAEKRAHQDAAQAQKDAQLKRDTREARRDQAHAIDLRHHVGERTQDGGKNAQQTRQVAAVARPKEVRNRELAELAQVGCQQQCHQAVAPGPPHDEGQAVVARQVQGSRQTDERGCRHPVGTGRHAVVNGRHPAAGHVVLGGVRGSAHDADAGIQQYRGQQEDNADPAPRQPELLQHRQHQHEDDKSARVPTVHLVQIATERLAGAAGLRWARMAFVAPGHVSVFTFLHTMADVQFRHVAGVEPDNQAVDNQ